MSKSKISISENLLDMNEINNKSNKLFSGLSNSSNHSLKASKNNAKKFYLLCKCGKIPSIKFFEDGQINYLCNNCPNSNIIISIEKIFDLLFSSDEKDIKNLKFNEHNEKYNFFYKKKYQSSLDEVPQKKNFCRICMNEHAEPKAVFFGRDTKTIEKYKYVYNLSNKDEALEFDDKSDYSEISTVSERNISSESENNKSENIEINAGDCILKMNENYNDIEEKEYKILNETVSWLEKIKELYERLFKIIIESYTDYPNYEYRKIISNMEKFATFHNKEYNKIILNYKFNEEDIKDSKIQLFGEIFVNNNKDNCFLIIKGKFFGLKEKIELKEIVGEEAINYPFILEVKLLERQRKVMHDFSSMFNEISTITPDSSFEIYDSSNIRSMKNMFYNCKTLEKLPDISILDTKNVENMSSMFYNCSSLKQLPDISKWNTSNLINANSMFERCSSLSISSFPGIYNWDITNILFMNNMFKNCKLLTNLPSFLNWNINRNAETAGLYEGINGIEQIDNKDNNYYIREKNIILKTLFFSVNNISKLYDKLVSFFVRQSSKNVLIFIKAFLSLIFPLIFIFGIIILENNREQINNPIEYYDSINRTNIKYIQQYFKINNSSIIKKNKEQYINIILNFTRINGNITFASSMNKYKSYNSLIIILLYIEIINSFFIFYEFKKKVGNYVRVISLIIITFFLIVLSIILNLLDFGLITTIFSSIDSFYYMAYKIFMNEYLVNNLELYFLVIFLGSKIWDIYFLYLLLKFFWEKFDILQYKKDNWNKAENFIIKRKNEINFKKICLIFCELIAKLFE